MENEKIISALTSIGLTRYEAEVYTTLVELGEASAREIADKSTVPREKVYYVLRRLSKQGLAKMVGKSPIKYIALPPKLTLKNKVEKIQKELKAIEAAVNALEERYNSGKVKIKRKNLNFWEMNVNLGEKLLNFIEGCENRLDAVLTVSESIRVEENWYYVLKKAAKRGIEINIYSPLKDANVKSLGRLSNVGEVKVIDDILDYSLYICDGESGFMVADDLKLGIHFIDKRFCMFMLRLIENIGRHSTPLESILNLVGYERDVYTLLSKVNKDYFLKLMVKGFEEAFLEEDSAYASKILEYYLSGICGEIGSEVSIQSIIDRIVSMASLMDEFNYEVSFDEETGALMLECEDDAKIAEAVERGKTIPPSLWIMLIQRALELKGYVEASAVMLYDKRAGKWLFQKKFNKLGVLVEA